MTNEIQNQVRNRAIGAILMKALTRWESLVTIAITAILFLFVQDVTIPGIEWQPWFWLVAGAIAEGALIVSTFTDPDATQQAVAREFEEKFDLSKIRSRVSRERIERAMEYRRSMNELTKRHSGAMKVSLSQTVADVNTWIAHMYDLALHIDAFDSNALVERDRKSVPGQLEKARQRLAIERDPAVRRDLEDQVKNLELQLQNIEATLNTMKRAEIQLDSTLSALGTVYAQMSLLGTKDVDSSRAQRLRLEIKDEVDGLQDTIHAMDEVQNQRLQLR
ncbi:hypothetical protein FBR02_06845 [Anaerolineae bacterium CFX9]|jgi:hypothetical protein|nr:hypothetical protein [Anaerolineae bacterium CFX9]